MNIKTIKLFKPVGEIEVTTIHIGEKFERTEHQAIKKLMTK